MKSLKPLHVLLAAIVLIMVAAVVWQVRERGTGAGAAAAAQAPGTIESSGEILGIRIGMPMEAARTHLDSLRDPVPYQPDEKERTGRRIYWKLQGTEYDWLMAWANAEGKVTRVRAVFRPEHRKRFAEIGDLARAITADSSTVRWNLQGREGTDYRLTAQGSEQLATSVYMFSQELPVKEHQQDAEPTTATP